MYHQVQPKAHASLRSLKAHTKIPSQILTPAWDFYFIIKLPTWTAQYPESFAGTVAVDRQYINHCHAF
jgi:hypothetical protein